MLHDSLAHYLAAIGVISLCEVGSRWTNGICYYGASLEEIAKSIESYRSDNRLLPVPTGEQPCPEHPLWCNRSRRSPARGVEMALAWLASMSHRERHNELMQLLSGQRPVIISSPNLNQIVDGVRMNPAWNLGTLALQVTGVHPAAKVSAWLPVLAWEAQRMILTTELRCDIGATDPMDMYSWDAPMWGIPLTLAEVFLLLNGGRKRWLWSGIDAALSHQLYTLRDTVGAGRTAEFIRGPLMEVLP